MSPLVEFSKKLDADFDVAVRLRSEDADQILRKNVADVLDALKGLLEAASGRQLGFTIRRDDPKFGTPSIYVHLRYGLDFRASYVNQWGSDAKDAIFRFSLFQGTPGSQEEPESIEAGNLKPWFYDGEAGWYRDGDHNKAQIVPQNLFLGMITAALKAAAKSES